MNKREVVCEPRAVDVFAALAGIRHSEASTLLTRAVRKHGGAMNLAGDVAAKDRESFTAIWEEALSQLRRAS